MSLILAVDRHYDAECDFSPTFILVVTLLLILEGLMFGLFTAIMCGSQLSAICSDETVTSQLFANEIVILYSTVITAFNCCLTGSLGVLEHSSSCCCSNPNEGTLLLCNVYICICCVC